MSCPLQPIHVCLNNLLFCISHYCANVMMFIGAKNDVLAISYCTVRIATVGAVTDIGYIRR